MTNLITDVANITTRQDGSFVHAPFRIPCGSVVHTSPSSYGRATRHRLMTDSAFARSASKQVRDSAAMDCMLPDSYFVNPEDAIIQQIEGTSQIDESLAPYTRAEPIIRREPRAKIRRLVVRSARGYKAQPVEIPAEEIDFTQNKDTIPSPPPAFDLNDIIDDFMQPQVAATFDDTAKPTTTSEVTEPLLLNARVDEVVVAPTAIASHLRQCGCGAVFAPPYNAPNAKMCQKCYRPILQARLRRQQAQAQQPKVVTPVIAQSIESTIRTMVQTNRLNELPEGATVKSNDGRQVIVLYSGKSMTIHLSQPHKAPNRGHHPSFRR